MASFSSDSVDALQIGHLMQHQRRKAHLNAVKVICGTSGSAGEASTRAPSEKAFGDALHHMKHSGSLRSGPKEQRRKLQQMVWCLAEARRSEVRSFLRTAVSIAIHQDGRTNRLCIRFSAVQPDLSCMRGILGQNKMIEGGHGKMREATSEVMTHLCTEGRGAPPRSHGKRIETTHLAELEDHIRTHVEVVDADGAADEQLAGRAMRRPVDGMPSLFPKCLMVVCDKTHVARRLTTRPWKADKFIQNVVNIVE